MFATVLVVLASVHVCNFILKLCCSQVCCQLHLRTWHHLPRKAGSITNVILSHPSNRCSMSQCQPVIDMSGVQQKGGVQLDRRIQLAHHSCALSHSWGLWGRQVNIWKCILRCHLVVRFNMKTCLQVLPWPLARGHWKTLQLWWAWGLDPGWCCSRCHWIHRTCGRIPVYIELPYPIFSSV